MLSTVSISTACPRAGLIRRLLAVVYDMLLLLAILFIVSAIAIALNQGEAIGQRDAFYSLYVSSLVVMSFLYYGWFWTHGGQTLGMKTWKLRLVTSSATGLSWRTALLYFCVAGVSWALLGAGFLWALFNPERETWHDIIAACVMQDVRHAACA
jgi:uncharacterized RDD family membrane protein YckC